MNKKKTKKTENYVYIKPIVYPSKKHNPQWHRDLFFEKDFTDYETVKKNADFIKWIDGTNPLTGRKCKTNRKTHMAVGRKLGYKTFNFYTRIIKILDSEKYLNDNKNKYIELENIKKYNISLKDICNKIDDLKWGETLLHNNIEYKPRVVNKNMLNHIEDDCGGNMKFSSYKYEPCECHICEDWGGCDKGGVNIYECDRCGFKYGIIETYSKNYKGK